MRLRPIVLIALLLALSALAQTAQAAQSAQTSQTSQSTETPVSLSSNGTRVKWPMKAEWKWKKNAAGAVTLFLHAVIRVPADVSEVKAQSTTLRMQLVKSDPQGTRGQKLDIQSGALHGKFEMIRAGVSTTYQLDIVKPSPALRQAKCSEIGLNIVAQPKELPFFIGARCVSTGDEKHASYQLHLTIPEEANVDESTLFEQEGKGEAWRIYQLGDVDTFSAGVAKIVVRFEDKPYELECLSG